MIPADNYHLSFQTSQCRIQFSDSHFRLQNILVIPNEWNGLIIRWRHDPFDPSRLAFFEPGTLNAEPFNPTKCKAWSAFSLRHRRYILSALKHNHLHWFCQGFINDCQILLPAFKIIGSKTKTMVVMNSGGCCVVNRETVWEVQWALNGAVEFDD